jgi:hypothetical protein
MTRLSGSAPSHGAWTDSRQNRKRRAWMGYFWKSDVIKGNLKKKQWAPEIIAKALKWESSSRFSFKRVKKAVWHWAGYSYNWAEHLLQLSWPSPTTELTYSYNWADLLLQLSWPTPTTELIYSYNWADLLLQLSWPTPTSELTYSNNCADLLLQLSWPYPTTELIYSYYWADLLLQLSWPSTTTELTYSYSITELNNSYNCSDPTVLTYSYNCADLHLHLTYSWSFSNFLFESRLCSRVSPAQW